MQKVFISLVVCVTFASCKKDVTVPDLGYAYFPDQVGTYVIYDVDSFVYNDFTHKIDTFQFQVKEIIESVYKDNTDRNTLRIERYYRQDPTQNWTIQDVWAANRTATSAERVEENQRFVKLIFPVKKGATWNGNASNTMGAQDYSYTYIDSKATVNGMSFDSTLLVTQQADSNLVEKKTATEAYAKYVGMVYKHIVNVRDNDATIDATKTFNERIDVGVDYCYRVNSYGR